MHSLRPLLIAALVVTEVAMWQWRMVIAHRGRRVAAMLLGFVGAALQITAISQVVADVHDVLSVTAYAGGVGCGVLFGIVAGERLTPGRLEVSLVSSAPSFAEAVWQRGWSAIAHAAHSSDGPVTTVHVEIDRRDATRLQHDARDIDPFAQWTAKEIRTEQGANMQQPPAVMRAVIDVRSRELDVLAERRRVGVEQRRHSSARSRAGLRLPRIPWRARRHPLPSGA